ncbi:MAG: hypothetical protein OMM_05206 [Candidatus Magnetoglobus multicellularis str. Araruama]|uniref:Response regulatory domain-containing protein n=1 Tax=Candidatus Magnetoglobus multicellularis str. Araruama TaxID=890399 RepID=A0A1V1NXL0_9BACT|nr:MAG: hypothetical protein OMM_05206 [Candidatus Magnetoglobus multicellularis str. Araruama]
MSQFNILVIDNSPTQRAVVMAYLKNRGYSASHASTHREALKLLNQKAIHLITLDWDMPDEKPLAFVQTLRNGWKHFDIPIVMMTEYNQSEEVIKAMNAGCDDYVTKTDGIELLEIRIRRLLAFHQLRDSNRFRKCQPHILLIDDCKTFLATTSRFLEEKQLRVTIADSGSKGLQTLESEAIDLILVDQVMPEMRGLEFIQQVRKNDSYRDIPIIMLVVKGLTDDIVSAISIGGIDDFLNKDTDLNLLENKIATLLRKKEESRQNNRQLIQEVKKKNNSSKPLLMNFKRCEPSSFRQKKCHLSGKWLLVLPMK